MGATTQRPGVAGRASSVRPGSRLATTRHVSNATNTAAKGGGRARDHERARAASPAESVMSVAAGAKRKERDYEADAVVGGGGNGAGPGGEETNINVVVRCRGRNDREVRENSAVVISTEGVKGNLIELSMGPNAVSNKTYHFDRVFSQAADQSVIFDDVVKPILEEMISGYNCTIFAYGQTGTGKTYTMSGDLTETMGYLSDEAGIIPRVLYSLFNKLEMDETDSSIKCSFIELYNEELRDLISVEESTKLKIYEDTSRKGQTATVVQGMEECHIKDAAHGIKILQEGSLKRQVAATKCNDLSSRSHTVFTITAYIKCKAENGEEYVSAGKLNLVDLAGSENIQRSGAENKRAAEAGLINKSLLTLGRVINALVDRSSHIPYRESKLTRLLQDSLGGRTKTCIIATVSPARSNLEETISTMDYAFRAKNIRNKPQMNALINKKALLRDYTAEIERLKSDLIATRHRNGVYLSNDAYEGMTVEAESRRILTEEQAAKIETLEANLRNKVQELFALTSSFMGLKKENESCRLQLDETKGLLDRTELVLAATRRNLAEEAHLRAAHEQTEAHLTEVGGRLIGTLRRTVHDVGGLHAKHKRRSDLQRLNRDAWAATQAHVSDATALVEARVRDFSARQSEHVSAVSARVQRFVADELGRVAAAQAALDARLAEFDAGRAQLAAGHDGAFDDTTEALDEIKAVRDAVKERVGDSLRAISGAARRIADDVLAELGEFHGQLHASYAGLGRDFRALFDDLARDMAAQRADADALRRRLQEAGGNMAAANEAAEERLREVVKEERAEAERERRVLTGEIAGLIERYYTGLDARLTSRTKAVGEELHQSRTAFEGSAATYSEGMDAWDRKEGELVEAVKDSREVMKTRLKDDWNAANQHSTSIRQTTESVHLQTVTTVDEQLTDLDSQMSALDGFVTRAATSATTHHATHRAALDAMAATVSTSAFETRDRAQEAAGRVREAADAVQADARTLQAGLDGLEPDVARPLATLREDVADTRLQEYEPTGDTPQKRAYPYPTELPRTRPHTRLIAELHGEEELPGDGSEEAWLEEQEAGGAAVAEGRATPAATPRFSRLTAAAATPSRPRSRARGGDNGGSNNTATLTTVTTTTTVPVVFSDPPSPQQLRHRASTPSAAAALAKFSPAPRPPIFSASLGPGAVPPGPPPPTTTAATTTTLLREINPNVAIVFDAPAAPPLDGAKGGGDGGVPAVTFVGAPSSALSSAAAAGNGQGTTMTMLPPLKRSVSRLPKGGAGAASASAGRKHTSSLVAMAMGEGRENVPPTGASAGGGRRKSPRLVH